MRYTYETVEAAAWDSTDGGNYSRVSQAAYPSGQSLEYHYELGWTPGGGTHKPDHFISRLRGIKFDGAWMAQYHLIGPGAAAVVDYPEPDVMLDYSLAPNGSRTAGQYPGLDRFGRIARQAWADGALAAGSGAGAGYPTIPPIVELSYSHNKVSSITEKWDARPGAGALWNRDQKYEYDGLHRLSKARRGTRVSSSSFTDATGGQKWTLDYLGNFKEFDSDLVSTFDSYTSNDRLIDGTFNMANEIDELSKVESGGGAVTLPFAYDHAGNIEEKHLTGTAKYIYRHDAWGRLVSVQFDDGSSSDRAKYQYNGLHMRVVKQSDGDVFDVSKSLDEQRLMYYSPGWQLLEEHVYEAWTSGTPGDVDRLTQTVWGARYVDDVVMRRQNNNYASGADTDFTDSPGDRQDDYYLTDHQFSVIAIVDGAGTLVERVSYDAYGEARHHWLLDVDGDGDVDAADNTTAVAANNKQIYQSGYNVHADFNRDGQVNRTDTDLVVSGNYASALGPGVLSASAVDNIYGYCGYIHNGEAFVYTVRMRHYDPSSSGGVGRWLERDPAGYVGGSNLYSYVSDDPVNRVDPSGLCDESIGSGGNSGSSSGGGGWLPPTGGSGGTAYMGKRKGCLGCYTTPGDTGLLQITGIGPNDPQWHYWRNMFDWYATWITPVQMEELPWWIQAAANIPDWALDPHLWLEAAGQIPGVGEIFDGFNAAWYFLEGDLINASAASAAMIPIIGNVVTASKWSKRAINVTGSAQYVDDVLGEAAEWLGPAYREIAPGVFRSADDMRQFRMTDSDLLHPQPHVHFETMVPGWIRRINVHTPLISP